jgi:capsid protein
MSANWFDHAIATVAPRMAARRVMARQAFETLTRGYDGAARGRRTEGWRAPGSSADTEIGVAGALLRDRMRDLVRNNPHAAKAVAVLVNNIIGAGIMPRAASGDDTLDRKVDALLERWTAECDADGPLDFYGLQTLICREMVEAGEVLVRRDRPVSPLWRSSRVTCYAAWAA